jgi:Flp pilus assembly protein TadD
MEIGQVLLETGKHQAALVCYKRAAQAAPSFQLKLQCGLILKQLGRFPEAVDAFKEALSFDDTSARVWFLLGICSQNLHDSVAAGSAYRKALELDPQLAEASVNLGTLLQDQGDLEAAKKAYGQALKSRADTFGRISQAMTAAPKGELWLDLGKLRLSLIA